MCWTVRYEETEGIIHLAIRGDVTIDLLRRILPEFMALSRRHDCLRTLVDYTQAVSKITLVDIFEVPGLLRRSGYDTRMRAAVVYGPASFPPANLPFWQTVSHNKGIFGVNFFTERQEARQWLSGPAGGHGLGRRRPDGGELP